MTATATRSPLPTRPDRWGRPGGLLAVLAGAISTGLVVALGVLAGTGALAPTGPLLFDPGAAVRYGLPVARTLHDLAAALTVGGLIAATWLIGPDPEGPPRGLTGARHLARRVATLAAGSWLLAGLAVLVLTVAEVAGLPLGAPGLLGLVVSFATQVDLGRALILSVLLVAVAANLAALATTVTTSALAAAFALAALLPLALTGHSAGSRNHANSVDSLGLHLVGVTVWVGGLAVLLVTAVRLGPGLAAVAARYSTLAGWSFALVAASGVINAALRLGSVRQLATTYGLMVLGKSAALVLLGAAGWWHRRATLPRVAGGASSPRSGAAGDPRRSAFLRLVAAELVVMGAAIGLAVALSRTAPPTPEATPEDPVAALLGYPVPPPLTAGRYLTEFYPSVLWLTVAAAALGGYGWGVLRLRRRGDAWPGVRTAFWTVGCLALVVVTSGGPAVYGRLSFSSHMLQHMILMIVVPLLLVFGAPVTLALRAIPARTDGSFGLRETVLTLVHARVLRVLGHPLSAAVLFTGSLVVFYYTGAFRLAMFTHGGHVLMTAHFLAVGYLFVWSLVGPDPGPVRPSYPLRVILLLITLAFHAFFGISLMESGTVLAPDWWQALGQTDRAALLDDQQTGGAIAWATGDLPSFALGLALVIGWVRSDTSEQRRRDRQADRDDDADLRAYNERLAALARRDKMR